MLFEFAVIYLYLAGKSNLVWHQPVAKHGKLGVCVSRGEMFDQEAEA